MRRAQFQFHFDGFQAVAALSPGVMNALRPRGHRSPSIAAVPSTERGQ
jgi:hypothetical protein